MKNLLQFDAVILAAGDFPSHKMPLSVLNAHKSEIICCDGAADELLKHGYLPKTIVGDGDSMSNVTKRNFSDRIFIVSEQESNDLTKSVRYAVSHGLRNIAILGATGKREDHTLGNISLLACYMDIANVIMFTDCGCFFPVTGKVDFKCFKGQQVSFFCMDASPLTVKNVKWTLQNRILTQWWQGTLNEAIGENIEIETQGKVVVFQKY